MKGEMQNGKISLGFYRTYEGLKRRQTRTNPNNGGSFYRTYEGLKHSLIKFRQPFWMLVFIVPMRD